MHKSGMHVPPHLGSTVNELEQYLQYLATVRRAASATIAAYRRDLNRYFEYLRESRLAAADAGEDTLRAFVTSLSKQGLKGRTVNRVISAVRGYYRFRIRMGYGDLDPTWSVRSMKAAKKLPVFLHEEEVDRFIGEPPLGLWDLRDRAIFELLYSTGCRVSEVIELDTPDVDFEQSRVVVSGKGGNERLVYIGSIAREALGEYILRRRTVRRSIDESGQALFINRQGGRLSDRGIRGIVERYRYRLDFAKRVTPHTFRHTFATHLLDHGANIRIVQEMLGHSSLSTTQVYTHTSAAGLRRVYMKSHPHAKKRDSSIARKKGQE